MTALGGWTRLEARRAITTEWPDFAAIWGAA